MTERVIQIYCSIQRAFPSGGSQLDVVRRVLSTWSAQCFSRVQVRRCISQDRSGYTVVTGTPKYRRLGIARMFFSSRCLGSRAALLLIVALAHGADRISMCQQEEKKVLGVAFSGS